MNLSVYVAFAAWFGAAVLLFRILPERTALLASMIGGWLFLPVAGFPVSLLHTKISFLSAVLAPLSVAAAPDRWRSLRPRAFDLPAALWCLWPLPVSLANGLGAYEGLSAALETTLSVGVPYLIGRAYFPDLEGLRELGFAIFLGGLAYVPFCLWEMRFSPVLHYLIYGFQQHSFVQTMRMGGYRPMVFMDHGLMVALWMVAATLIGLSLWRSGGLRSVLGIPARWLVGALFVTTLLCKSAGALGLLAVGLLARALSLRLRTPLALLIVLLIAPAYLTVRVTRAVEMASVVELADRVAGDERADSLAFRIRNEELILTRALQRAATGWGRWGRFLLRDPETSEQITIPDGLWIIALGEWGVVGLAAITLLLVLPSLLFLRRFPPATWKRPELATPVALGFLLPLYMIDNLLNAMVNPIYFLAAGALMGLSPGGLRAARPAWQASRTDRSPAPSRVQVQPRHGSA